MQGKVVRIFSINTLSNRVLKLINWHNNNLKAKLSHQIFNHKIEVLIPFNEFQKNNNLANVLTLIGKFDHNDRC